MTGRSLSGRRGRDKWRAWKPRTYRTGGEVKAGHGSATAMASAAKGLIGPH